MLERHIITNPIPPVNTDIPNYVRDPELAEMTIEDLDDRTPEEVKKDDNSEEEIYSIKNFSI